MNDIKEKNFDYSLVDEDTAEFLQEKEDNIKRSVGRAAYEMGKELKEAKEKIEHGYKIKIFNKWCESIGISSNRGYVYIEYYNAFDDNFFVNKKLEKLPVDVVANLVNSDDEVKKRVKNGEVNTQKEYWELKKQIKQEKKQKEKLQEQVEKLKNQEPETKIKEVEKEVIPDDYEDVKQKAESLEKAHDFMKEQKQELEEQLQEAKKEKQETKKEVEDFQQLKNQVDKLRKRKDEIGMQVDSAANLSRWMMDIKKVLQNDLAPIKYSEDIANQAHDSIVMDNILDVVEQVEEWCYDMRGMIEESQNTINTEVINNE